MDKCKENHSFQNQSLRIEFAKAFLKTFEDFEQEWLDLEKEFQVVFDSG